MGLPKYKAIKSTFTMLVATSSEVDIESSEGELSTRVNDVRRKTLGIVFEMLPHNKAPTMTETIMETLMPLFERRTIMVVPKNQK